LTTELECKTEELEEMRIYIENMDYRMKELENDNSAFKSIIMAFCDPAEKAIMSPIVGKRNN
jgi:hypothetical protein